MATSLQEQLLKAGLVDNKKAKQINKDKKKQAKKQYRGEEAVNNDAEKWAKEAKEAKLAKDKELSRIANAEAEQKAIVSQIAQLIESHKISRQGGEIGYQFTDEGKIKKLYVTDNLQNQLAKGVIAVARAGEAYELVPAATARKIMERDEHMIVVLNSPGVNTAEVEEDDPYAGYEIPDDLMW